MCIQISGINSFQSNLLQEAFGYHSFPNGNGGHTKAAYQWLIKNVGDSRRHIQGDAGMTSAARWRKVYFTSRQVRELRELAKARGY